MTHDNDWEPWFAWRPVKDEWGNLRWLVPLERRWSVAVGTSGGWIYRGRSKP